jgi:predicted transcriptional regulator
MASTASPDRISDAFRKTDTRLRQLLKALRDNGPDSNEFAEAVNRARKRARDNRELLD